MYNTKYFFKDTGHFPIVELYGIDKIEKPENQFFEIFTEVSSTAIHGGIFVWDMAMWNTIHRFDKIQISIIDKDNNLVSELYNGNSYDVPKGRNGRFQLSRIYKKGKYLLIRCWGTKTPDKNISSIRMELPFLIGQYK